MQGKQFFLDFWLRGQYNAVQLHIARIGSADGGFEDVLDDGFIYNPPRKIPYAFMFFE
jgi:hypothetical protein